MTSAHLFLGSLPNFHICHNFPRNWTQAEIGADPRWTMGASTKFPVLPFQRTFHPQLAGVFMRAGCWGIQGRKRWMKNLPNWRSLSGRCHHQTPEKPPSPHKKLPIFFSPTTKGLHHSCSVVSSSSRWSRNSPKLANTSDASAANGGLVWFFKGVSWPDLLPPSARGDCWCDTEMMIRKIRINMSSSNISFPPSKVRTQKLRRVGTSIYAVAAILRESESPGFQRWSTLIGQVGHC